MLNTLIKYKINVYYFSSFKVFRTLELNIVDIVFDYYFLDVQKKYNYKHFNN